MASPMLLFAATFLFGILVGFVVGMSNEKTAGRDLMVALLGGGFITQLFTILAGVDIDLASTALLGFALGALIGLGAGFVLRKWVRGYLVSTNG